MDDREAIEIYDRAGAAGREAMPAIRWPHLPLDDANCARLVEGVLDEHCDCVRLAFGDEFDGVTLGERVSEAWRTDTLQTRYAPEGVFIRAAFSVRVEIAPEDESNADIAGPDAGAGIMETLSFVVELCVSYTNRHHVRPFVDFMGGEVRRAGDDTVTRLEPFAREIAPADAVAWGLNSG